MEWKSWKDADDIIEKGLAETIPDLQQQKQAEKQPQHDLTTKQLRWQKKMRYQPESVKMRKEDGPRHEYYKKLTGSESQNEIEIPRAICVADRVESSAKEMKTMLKAVSQHTNNRAILQKIPRHMRRRAASHSKKRLPRRLHKLAEDIAGQSQKGSSEGKVAKAPNRKKRRRKRDLQNEFAKRSGKHGWLETHIWHAKRFHMTESNDPMYSGWGNRVALFPNDKSFRACYRAVSKHCLIQDISYLRCLHLSGSIDDLLQLLKLVSPDTEFDCIVLEGQKEKDILMYKRVQVENTEKGKVECIGPASVLWRPPTCTITEDKSRELLLWIHPTILCSSLEVLTSACKEDDLVVEIRNISDELLRFRLTGPKSSVTLLSALRPLNHIPSNKHNQKCQIGEWLSENKDLVARLHKDYNCVMTDCHRRIFARSGNEVGSNSVPEYPNGSLFPVITDDPRLALPLDKETPTLTKLKKRLNESDENSTETRKDIKSSKAEEMHDGIICESPIWNGEIRNQVSSSRLPDHIVSTRKREQKFQLMGSKIHNKTLTSAVPILIIRKAGNEDRLLKTLSNPLQAKEKSPHCGPDESFASGWDIVLPRSWGTAFWIPLIYNRARAGGLRENKNTCLECLTPHFPQDYPDTEPGKFYWNAEANKLANKYYRKPPAKRPNYSVLAVPNPFKPDWNELFDSKSDTPTKSLKRLAEDCIDAELEVPEKRSKIESNHKSDITCNDLVVADDNSAATEEMRKQMEIDLPKHIDKSTEKGSNTCERIASSQITVLRSIDRLIAIKEWVTNVIDPKAEFVDEGKLSCPISNPREMICVGVKSLNKGIPFSRSMICIPTHEDLDNLCKDLIDPYKYGLQSITGPCEPKHWDPYRKERKEARKVARKRKKNKKDKVLISDDVGSSHTGVSTISKQPQTFSVRPCKEVMGHITSGDFVFSHACGAGIGFVSTEKLALLALDQAKHESLKSVLTNETSKNNLLDGDPIVPLFALIRNTDSVQYRFVKLEIQKSF